MSLKKTTAWKAFADYIKARDNYTCVTCGTRAKGQAMNAGHFIQAYGHASTFFEQTNVHAQCVRCNLSESGNILAYRRYIIKRYGEGYDFELEMMGRAVKQWSKKELKEIAKTYREKLKELNANRLTNRGSQS